MESYVSTGIWVKKHIQISESLIWPSTSNALCYKKATWRVEIVTKIFFFLFQEALGKRKYNHQSFILLFIFFLSLSCVPKWNHWFRVTSESQSIISIVCCFRNASHWAFTDVWRLFRRITPRYTCLQVDNLQRKSTEKKTSWTPSICL